MNRIELACYSLIASAFVLAAMLVYNLENRIDSQANAGVVVSRDNFTVLTARINGGNNQKPDEALFVLSNIKQCIIVYRVGMDFKPAGVLDLTRFFDNGAAAGGGGGHGPASR